MQSISSGEKKSVKKSLRAQQVCEVSQLADEKKKNSWRLMGFGLSLGTYLMYDVTGSRQVHRNTGDFRGSGAQPNNSGGV